MYMLHRPVARYEIRLPDICAWCGQRPGDNLHTVQLYEGIPLSGMRYTTQLPICSECESYVRAYLAARLRLCIHLTIVLLPLMLGLIYVLLRPLHHPLVWISWFILGGGSAWLAAQWLSARLVRGPRVAQQVSSLTGSPPPGYTAWGSDPVRTMGRGRLHFSSRDFQRAFTQLNPDLPLCVIDNWL